jgi:hypothetical protein
MMKVVCTTGSTARDSDMEKAHMCGQMEITMLESIIRMTDMDRGCCTTKMAINMKGSIRIIQFMEKACLRMLMESKKKEIGLLIDLKGIKN